MGSRALLLLSNTPVIVDITPMFEEIGNGVGGVANIPILGAFAPVVAVLLEPLGRAFAGIAQTGLNFTL